MCWLMVCQYRHLLVQSQHNSVWKRSLKRCSYVIVLPLRTLVPDAYSSVWIDLKLCSGQRLLLLCSLRHSVFTPGPNDGLHFFYFSFDFERHWRHFTVQRNLLRTCLTHCLSRWIGIFERWKEWFACETIAHYFARQARTLTYFV